MDNDFGMECKIKEEPQLDCITKSEELSTDTNIYTEYVYVEELKICDGSLPEATPNIRSNGSHQFKCETRKVLKHNSKLSILNLSEPLSNLIV